MADFLNTRNWAMFGRKTSVHSATAPRAYKADQGAKRMEALVRESKSGFRLMLRNPVFTLVAMVAVTLAVWENKSIIAALDPLLFRAASYATGPAFEKLEKPALACFLRDASQFGSEVALNTLQEVGQVVSPEVDSGAAVYQCSSMVALEWDRTESDQCPKTQDETDAPMAPIRKTLCPARHAARRKAPTTARPVAQQQVASLIKAMTPPILPPMPPAIARHVMLVLQGDAVDIHGNPGVCDALTGETNPGRPRPARYLYSTR